ncbi:uncharacterized protein LOC123529594 isoform X2 [Mercenaria mercenaria]|uniref:uncharacterized protein LOC123529594 isoform X2 n=1 Tax=Mercenaria mercenaria TaxID=6596 RepID=UPI00234EF6FD|nr:uncharacterized protein LOC123529594 isoform X2 [Mercenaria mercenaria]
MCNVSSMRTETVSTIKEQSTCIDPSMVPGFKDFCMDILHSPTEPSPGPANINNDEDQHVPPDSTIHESKLILDNGNCFGTAILVSVAIGCFLAGGFSVWLVMFCCRMSMCLRSPNKNTVVADASNGRANWNSTSRDRPIGSTSSAQLLTNASAESMSTNNTLLSTGESPPFDKASAAWNRSGRQQGGHSRSPSAPWPDIGRPLLPSSRSRSAQWNGPRRTTSAHSTAQTSHWADSGLMSLPNAQTPSASWIDHAQPSFTNGHSHSAPWLDTIYSPASESSSRDYQSIHGGSENPYAPCSESSSDYSAAQSHRVMIIRDGEIYQPSSESSGSNNDYTSLKGQRFSRQNESIYYPTSEGSNKDYASLSNEKDKNMISVSNFNAIDETDQRENENHLNNVTFNVSGLTFPAQACSRSNLGWASNLQEINEYETVDSTLKHEEKDVDVSHVRTLADMCDVNHNTESTLQAHEYFTLEPLQNQKM